MMDEKSLEILWGQLEIDTQPQGFIRLRINPEACFDVFLAVEKPLNARALLIEVKADAIFPGLEYPQSRGVDVYPVPIVPGPGGSVRIIVKVKDIHYNDVFTILVKDILKHVFQQESQYSSVQALIARLNRWQNFLRTYTPGMLSDQERLGLYGELWLIKKLISEVDNTAALIKAWVGPAGANQDFQFAECAIEVKTTSGGPHEVISISNVRQLDTTGINMLYLYHLTLDIRTGGIQSLPELVSEVRVLLRDKGEGILDIFNDKLMEARYIDSMSAYYEDRKYSVRHERIYEVTDGFPKITEQDLMPGVGDVRYTIAISACKSSEVQESRLVHCLTRGTPSE
jgi:hypothetical protein